METTYSGLLGGYVYGTGYQQVKVYGAQAAGSPLPITPPGDRAYRLISGYFEFTTSATAGNRHVVVAFQDGAGNYLGRYRANAAQATSTTVDYTTGIIAPPGGTTTAIPIPDLIVTPGFTISLDADGIDAADQVVFANLLFEEFPIGRDGYSVSGVTEWKW